MNLKKISLIIMLAGSLAACKKELVIEPEQSVSDQTVFTSKAGAQAALTGVYSSAQILDVFGALPQLINDYLGDNVEFVGSFPTLQEINQFTTIATNTNVQLIWQNHYRVIIRANTIIERVPGVTENSFTDAQKKQMVAEAKFMRAITYFQLVNLFAQPYNCNSGNTPGVPLVLKEFTAGQVEFPGRSTVAQVHAQIKKDLEEAVPDLPATHTTAVNTRGRATKGAARALLSRFHLYRGEWAEAASRANEVITATPTYALAPNYSHFDQTTAEDIFVSIMTTTDNSRTGSGGWGSYYRPSPGGRGDAPFSTSLVQAFLAEPGDKRLSLSDSAVAADNVRRRFTLKYPDATNNSDDAPLIRVTEMYLNRAEALAEAGGINQTSIDLMNALRRRAGLAEWNVTTFSSKQEFVDAILNERRKELAFEGHRRMDLLRKGKPLRTTGPTAAISAPCTGQKIILPIPQRELDINPTLKGQQNPGY
jgi:hypothetical protein